MDTIKQVLENHWKEHPNLKDLKHCVYQGEKLKDVKNSYFVNKKTKFSQRRRDLFNCPWKIVDWLTWLESRGFRFN